MRPLLGDREAACEAVIMRSATPDGTWEGFNPADPDRTLGTVETGCCTQAASTAIFCQRQVKSAKGGVVRLTHGSATRANGWNDDKCIMAAASVI